MSGVMYALEGMGGNYFASSGFNRQEPYPFRNSVIVFVSIYATILVMSILTFVKRARS